MTVEQPEASDPVDQFTRSDAAALRALAGPGSGKTFALVRRLARLLDDGVPPARILVVTFARTAARDLVRAVAHLEAHGGELIPRTLHSYCFGLLGREHVLEATGRVPRILLGYETDFLLGDLRGDFGTLTERRDLLEAFVAAWARRQSEEPGQPVPGLDQEFQTAVRASFRWHRATHVGEVVPIALSYLKNNPQAPERSAYDHVLVDEYQDLNRAEQEVVNLLSSEGAVAVIGDDDQSIYAFKHANPEGIREFHHERPETEDVHFLVCHRCPQRIVAMAEALIARNPRRMKDRLTPKPDNPLGEIHHVQWRSVPEEAQGIARFIKARTADGIDPGKVLVLANSRLVGYAIRDALRSDGVECNSYFREEAVAEERAREIVTLLTLLGAPDDRVALRAWLAFGSPTGRRGGYRRLVDAAWSSGSNAAEILRQLDAGEVDLPYTGTVLERWRELQVRLEELRPLTEDLPALIDTTIPVEDDGLELLRFAALTALEEAESASELAEGIRYGVSQRETPLEAEEARVMSLHASKGLTAELVVVAGAVEGLIPRIDEMESPGVRQRQEEEQRRLAFVGITRTTKILVISSYSELDAAMTHRLQVKKGPRRGPAFFRVFASSFLDEMGPNLPQAVRGEDWDY